MYKEFIKEILIKKSVLKSETVKLWSSIIRYLYVIIINNRCILLLNSGN